MPAETLLVYCWRNLEQWILAFWNYTKLPFGDAVIKCQNIKLWKAITAAAAVWCGCNEGGSVLSPIGLQLPAPFVGDEMQCTSCFRSWVVFLLTVLSVSQIQIHPCIRLLGWNVMYVINIINAAMKTLPWQRNLTEYFDILDYALIHFCIDTIHVSTTRWYG